MGKALGVVFIENSETKTSMTTERQKVIAALEPFVARLEKCRSTEGITLDSIRCGILWSYLKPAVDMLKQEEVTEDVRARAQPNPENITP